MQLLSLFRYCAKSTIGDEVRLDTSLLQYLLMVRMAVVARKNHMCNQNDSTLLGEGRNLVGSG